MAINLNESRGLDKKRDGLLDATFIGTLERGMVMVYSANESPDGEQLVIPCSGTAGEKVAGFLWYSETFQDTVPTIEILSIPAVAPYTVTLRFTPTSVAVIRAVNNSTNAPIVVVAGAPGAGQLGLTGKTLTADPSLAGVTIRVTYRYAITPAELARRGGRRSVNQGAERVYNQVTLVFNECRVFTSCFDTSQAYDPVTAKTVYCGAGGFVTTAAGGTAIGQVFHIPVLKLTPGIEQAFVGVEAKFPIVP